MLTCLDDTERALLSKQSDRPMFLAETTLFALRVTIKSTISLTEELLNTFKYKYVLTGKLNQDCVEVGLLFIV